MKRYNTPHRSHVVKTRMTDEEYADFTERLTAYEMSQSEFIRQAITRATIWFPCADDIGRYPFCLLSIGFESCSRGFFPCAARTLVLLYFRWVVFN